MVVYLLGGPPHRRAREPLTCTSDDPARVARIALRVAHRARARRSSTSRSSIIAILSFNSSRIVRRGRRGLHARLVAAALRQPGPRDALWHVGQDRRSPPRRSRWCSARWRPSRSSASGSSDATRSQSADRAADRAARHRHRHRARTRRFRQVGVDARLTRRLSSPTRRSASSCVFNNVGRPPAPDVARTSRRRRPTSAPTASRPSGT